MVGKMKEVAELNITEICETRCVENEDFTNEELRIILDRNEKGEKSGVAVILRGKWKKYVFKTYHVNDIIMIIKLKTWPTNLYIIQVYFLTKNSKDEEIENKYEQLEDLVILAKDNSNLFIMGDFNAAVSCQVS